MDGNDLKKRLEELEASGFHFRIDEQGQIKLSGRHKPTEEEEKQLEALRANRDALADFLRPPADALRVCAEFAERFWPVQPPEDEAYWIGFTGELGRISKQFGGNAFIVNELCVLYNEFERRGAALGESP